ncbi:hypothetical protein LTR97_012001 [Elasticomyces elasticus]|uniref:Uncharacterized protein n=1 Tax=Elasticomyces elasticus TaxID=574655 RepID=A0AAN7VL64_9PEZI|nr:hypothetical protein LTR97_012001 [Elasticomyces elasticus]
MKYKKWEIKAFNVEANNNRRSLSQEIEVELAFDTHFSKKHFPGRHVDNDIKRMFEFQIMRGRITSKKIKVVLKGCAGMNESHYGAWRTFALGY